MFDLSKVYKVYSGRLRFCMCGCAGKYTVASAHREEANRERGYDYTDEEVSDVTVRRIVGKILSAAEPVMEDNYIHAVVGKRFYVAYLLD